MYRDYPPPTSPQKWREALFQDTFRIFEYDGYFLSETMADLGRTVDLAMYYGAKPDLKEIAREMRKNPTKVENILWQQLRNKKFEGRIFRRQHPVDIFIVDFYCHSERLVIEVDGGVHEVKDIKSRDQGRTDEMNRFDLRVIRFTNEEIINDMTSVLEKIKQNFLPTNPPSPSGEGYREG